ncbi:hypothetical protein SDA22_00135 [Legionella pneumophila serogroup 1]|uniref:hypothetical protein n=1 Tax=Legionella pneumophila TaxID=446 RepID=UPI001E511118|nr:hypothetical protein [Legionella pneumophila]MCZ4738850.1 hypothetical protein [Legionella pneumophila]MCZ4747078.1 hypothetical protein [Legionella pneumophila]MDI9827273.1 hypothetical protein [Legionella pneumophila]MDI9844265.1 hypothetical protein [Legionella pneumophila]MDO5157279.1 hypothetical protein [Legionella pneumophila]
MSREEEQAKKKLEEDKVQEEKLIRSTVDDYIREFSNMLHACEQRARRKPADSAALSAEKDAHTLREFLDDLQKAQQEGHGDLPILRTPAEWAAIDQMRQRCVQYQIDPMQNHKMKNEKTEKLTHDSQVSEENLRRLQILDRYKETPRSEEEEEKERKRLINLATSGNNTFIAYEDLEKIAKSGKPFFIPPNSKEDACLSCGNGRLYKGSLSEIRMQLEFDLKKDPDNEQMRTGLRRIENEIFMKPNLASPKKEKDFTEAGITPQENTYTTPNPFSIKPKKEPI